MADKNYNTFYALDNAVFQAGIHDPSAQATGGRAGSLFVQVPPIGSAIPFQVWQKQDEGVTTNWTAFGGGGGGGVTTVGAIDTPPKSANGAHIVGTTIFFQLFDSSFPGMVPTSPGTATDFLRADGTWAVPAGGGSVTPLDNVMYVALNGNDGTGDGSIAAPYLTIQAAIDAAVLAGATTANPYSILIASGVYASAPILLNAGVSLIGLGGEWSTNVSAIINLDASWTGATFKIASLQNLYIGGNVSLSFPGGAGSTDIITMNNCILAADLIVTATDDTSNMSLSDVQIQGDATFTGGSQRLDSVAFQGTLTLNSVVGAANLPCMLLGCQVEGAMTVNAALLANSVTVQSVGTMFATVAAVQNTVTLNGLGAFFHAAGASLPLRANIVYAGGATEASSVLYLSDALALGYTPTTPADWSPVPLNVQEALDLLAAGASGAPTWERETFVIAAPDIVNGYLDLANTSIDDSVNPIIQGSGPLIGGSIAGGDDFEMSIVGPITRVTFAPAVVAAWIAGQRVQIQYQF